MTSTKTQLYPTLLKAIGHVLVVTAVTNPIFHSVSLVSNRIVKHCEINHSDYYTISSEGVTHVRDNEAEFTALERWEKEYRDYKRLVKIPTFANFRMWKAFVVWRKNVKTK